MAKKSTSTNPKTTRKVSSKTSAKTSDKKVASTQVKKKPRVKAPTKKAASKKTSSNNVIEKSTIKTTAKKLPTKKLSTKTSSSKTSSKNKSAPSTNGIGQLNETELHAALKEYCASDKATFEVKLEGYFIDVVEKDLLIEIQTRNFSAIKPKLKKLLRKHKLRLVHPIAQEKWLVKQDGDKISRRKSPKRGKLEHIFDELIRIPELVKHKNFSLEVLLISSEENRLVIPKRRKRDKGWKPTGKRLLEVHESYLFKNKSDFIKLLPKELPSPFTTADLVKTMGVNKALASKIAFCYRKMGYAKVCGKQGRFIAYKIE